MLWGDVALWDIRGAFEGGDADEVIPLEECTVWGGGICADKSSKCVITKRYGRGETAQR